MIGKVNVTLRPIKIAFLVEPGNKKAILEAIKINSFLWGGIYNPIIPVIKRIPTVWKKNDKLINFRNNATKISLGYIDNFDLDYFVVLGKCDVSHLKIDKKQIIPVSEILANVDDDGTPCYGVGLFELLNYFIDKELKFVRKNPLDIAFANFGQTHSLFLASIFGKLPKNIVSVIKENYNEYLGAKNEKVDIDNYANLLRPNALFLRRFTSLYIDSTPSSRGMRSGCIFFMDADNPYDIIDYWNLRAMGWSIIPVAKQSIKSEATKKMASEFIEENFGQSRHNKDIFHNTTILKSRSVEDKEPQEFIESLKIPRPENLHASKVVFQHWYPRMWDEWARDKDGVGGCEIAAGQAAFELPENDTQVDATTVDPKFISRFGGKGTPRFANILTFSIYGGKDLLAHVIPAADGGWDMVRAIGGMEPDTWRFSRKELVHLVKHPNWSISLSVPLASEVFSAWMKSMGWEISLSSPGKIAYQMMRRLGGARSLSILSHEDILNLLQKFEGGKIVNKEVFFAEINKTIGKKRFLNDKTKVAEWLLQTGLIKLGAELQCPTCQQHSWYAMNDLNYRLQCHNCFEDFEVPIAAPDQIKWAYRAFGPFSLPGKAYGVYSVLLTLRFFSQLIHDLPLTAMLSFLAKNGSKEMEIDLGLFLKETRYGVTDTRLIFAECKSFKDEFQKSDIDKMKLLAEKFPGAIIVFATLRKELTAREKKLLIPFVNKGRRSWKTEQPYNPVLILTSTELLSDWGPPHCWEDAGAFYKPFAAQYKNFWKELIPLCDITQQMYLGLNPWNDWIREKWEKRKKTKSIIPINNPET